MYTIIKKAIITTVALATMIGCASKNAQEKPVYTEQEINRYKQIVQRYEPTEKAPETLDIPGTYLMDATDIDRPSLLIDNPFRNQESATKEDNPLKKILKPYQHEVNKQLTGLVSPFYHDVQTGFDSDGVRIDFSNNQPGLLSLSLDIDRVGVKVEAGSLDAMVSMLPVDAAVGIMQYMFEQPGEWLADNE